MELSDLATYDPVLNYARPDVEALVWGAVRPYGGVVTWGFSSDESIGLRGWLTRVDIQIDVRSGHKADAFRRADVIRRVVCALPFTQWGGGVVVRVDTTSGPDWLPDGDGKPRYVARYAVFVHPRPAG